MPLPGIDRHDADLQNMFLKISHLLCLQLNLILTFSMFYCFSLKTHRNFYNDLSDKLSMDPRAVIGDDPLSQDDEVTTVFGASLIQHQRVIKADGQTF